MLPLCNIELFRTPRAPARPETPGQAGDTPLHPNSPVKKGSLSPFSKLWKLRFKEVKRAWPLFEQLAWRPLGFGRNPAFTASQHSVRGPVAGGLSRGLVAMMHCSVKIGTGLA